jgi:hypothetical protein
LSCEPEALEALVLGELPPEQARLVATHAESCRVCGEELRWLNLERTLMAERARRMLPPKPGLWQTVEQRLLVPSLASYRKRRARRFAIWASLGMATSAAAIVASLVMQGPAPPIATVDRDRGRHHRMARLTASDEPRIAEQAVPTLTHAEQEYQQAIATLEREYAAKRSRLDPEAAQQYDAIFLRARTLVAEARGTAGTNVDAHMHVLDGYAAYLDSLTSVVDETEDGRP